MTQRSSASSSKVEKTAGCTFVGQGKKGTFDEGAEDEDEAFERMLQGRPSRAEEEAEERRLRRGPPGLWYDVDSDSEQEEVPRTLRRKLAESGTARGLDVDGDDE